MAGEIVQTYTELIALTLIIATILSVVVALFREIRWFFYRG